MRRKKLALAAKSRKDCFKRNSHPRSSVNSRRELPFQAGRRRVISGCMTTADQIALVVAIVAGLGLVMTFAGVIISRAANAINRASGLQQIAVAERELFLSLVDGRTNWMNDYMEAFMERQNEWRLQVHRLVEGEPVEPLPWERRLRDLSMVAGWMFDQQVIDDVNTIERHQSKALDDYWAWLRQGGEKLDDLQAGPDAEGMGLAHEALGVMIEHMNRYLYVGDIQRQARQ